MSAVPTIDAKRSGIYGAPVNVQALHQAATAAGLVWLDMPLAAVTNKDQFLKVAKKQMKLPAHFGENWDALADCLRDFAWLKAKGYVLYMTDGGKFAKAAPDDYQTALEVLGEAAAFWKAKKTPFVVLVQGSKELPAY